MGSAEQDSDDEFLDDLMTSFRAKHVFGGSVEAAGTPAASRTAPLVLETKLVVPEITAPAAATAVLAKADTEPTATKPAKRPRLRDSPVNAISYQASKFTQAGKVLQDCIAAVDGIVDTSGRLLIYKIGATNDPESRWQVYLNDLDRYENMRIIAQVLSSDACAYLEAAVIREYLGRPGCRNEGLGGERVSTASSIAGKYFVYVVWRPLSRLPPVVRSMAQRS
jgi:hypothetical protein